ncbi:hypothetical protein PYW08_009732 [Mythimna loreyi]|uniref:Uncharacterized protein n=1 Tax=Mythimna loreyi TaxID=667449 RepID=A0ACC2Q7X6_9NEOP|nr:hypothetical protein PYW08_009732 [Mythimna loreyi]
MNKQLIEKIITANNLPCPQFTYENPVLDRNVAKALSKSFVKILNLSQTNSKVNNNLRLSILENVRRMCQVEPENHIKVDENYTNLLLEFYEQIIKDSAPTNNDSTERSLDAFLVRNLKDMNLSSSQKSTLNPEVVQALVNLNQNGMYLNALLKDIIHWNSTETQNIRILNDIWTSDCVSTVSQTAEDVSIKLKPDIEKCILEICHNIFNEADPNIDVIFSSDAVLKNLVKKASKSANCFQICCGVLNYLFVMTNFDTNIQMFVQMFVQHVKEYCSLNEFSILYPTHLSHIVVLLDIDLVDLPQSLQNSYIESTIMYLSEIKTKLYNDFIMLLCHFPQWFDIYFQ